jgi:predicted RNA polymerase sigma factor
VVALNRAVAVSMVQGPAAGLRAVEELDGGGRLTGSHLLPGVRGELLRRLGRTDEARSELAQAVRLCTNDRERAALECTLRELA